MQLRDGNQAAQGPPETPVRRRLPVRWWIVGMLFVGSVVNYLDRITLSIVAPMIRDEFGLSASDYALVVNVFLVAYTFSYGFGGKLADFLGTRASYYVTVTWWSIAACLHTLTQGLYSLCAYRFLLGLGEAGFFPTGVKAISEWFHPRDRGKPISIMLLGLGIGALLGPPVVSWLTLNVGWRAMFLITGTAGISAAAALDLHLSQTGRASTADGRGAGISSGVGQGGPRRHRSKDEGQGFPALSRGLDAAGSALPGGRHLVFLPLLDARVPDAGARLQHGDDRRAALDPVPGQ